MATAEVTTEQPRSPEEAARLLKSLGEAGRAVRPLGGRTKQDWGGAGEPIGTDASKPIIWPVGSTTMSSPTWMPHSFASAIIPDG